MNATAIPAELRERRQWLTWQNVDGRKIPNGKSNDPTTWTDFAEIEIFDNIAFVIDGGDPYTGIDLDGCLVDGDWTEWARPILERFQGVAYCEVSPSGSGVKLTTKGKKPDGSRCTRKTGEGKQQIECYDHARFWTVTSNVVVGFEAIGDGQEAVDWLCTTYLSGDQPQAGTKRTSGASSSSSSLDLLKRAQAYADKMAGADVGELRNAAFRNAGHLHAIVGAAGERLTDNDVYHLLRGWNARNAEPLRDDELLEAANNARKNGTPPADKLPSNPLPTADKLSHDCAFDLGDDRGRTDIANARRFVDRYERELLFVPPWRKWLTWDGSRWKEDCGVGANQRAARYATKLWETLPRLSNRMNRDELGKVLSFIKSTNQAAKMASFLGIAAMDERVVCDIGDLNSEPTLLNVVNGTVDLSTGELRPHNPANRITQIAKVAYDADAKCEKWLETLGLIFDHDETLIRYVQQLLGYSLSGETGEHILPIAYGKGCNGKSTVWNVVADLLGDYASLANDELLLGDSRNHPTEKAALYQKRFVAISEPEKSSRLKESRVKELTGDRVITARRMHEDFWSFERTHTFWISSNHLPRIEGTDEGIWRRVKLIPFGVDLRQKVKPIPDFDQWLLKHEGAGILAWMVRGYLDYKQHGLCEPESVTAATSSYRADSDELGEYIAEWCVLGDHERVSGSELYAHYVDKAGKKPMSKNAFGQAVAERFEKVKTRGRNTFKGLRLRTDDEKDQPPANPAKSSENEEGGIPGDTKNIRSGNPYANCEPSEKVSPGVPLGPNEVIL